MSNNSGGYRGSQGGYQPRSNPGGGYRPGGGHGQAPTGGGGRFQGGGGQPPAGGRGSEEGLVPLPKSLRDKVGLLTHPGLALDKYAETMTRVGEELNSTSKQENQIKVLKNMVKISQGQEPQTAWQQFHARQRQVWQALGCQQLEMETISGLSLHLARASALENAGICLHNLYGFPIIPGSGLKGLVRAWATNERVDLRLIHAVFGPSADEIRQGVPEQAGSIVFYDAIPAAWPDLTVDIVNNHHRNYYDGQDAPGDWESPVPVYFLTVKPGAKFVFALGKARADVPDTLLNQVCEWLQAALTWSGAGAKTNAGYGLFKALAGPVAQAPKYRTTFSATLELVTPAFLAGAMQDGSDCDLRPATLRGMLRWWWRTLHSGYLTSKKLLELEDLIFGSAAQGGALQIRVEAQSPRQVMPYDKNQLVQNYPPTGDRKTTQGLWYHSFGMHDGGKQRHVLAAGAKWEVTLLARDHGAVSAQDILAQAQCALELLCQYGAVGAKQRKGWGSFADLPGFDAETCKRTAQSFRSQLGLTGRFDARLAESPALEHMLAPLEIATPWTNAFWVLHQVGMAAQMFAKEYKHQREKQALGLPRRIGNPQRGNFRSNYRLDRHSSPTQFHISKKSDGTLVVRALFFIAPRLPDAATSREFLSEYRTALQQGITGLLKAPQKEAALVNQPQRGSAAPPARSGGYQPRGGTAPPAPVVSPPTAGVQAGDKVMAVLLEEKTKKGGWKAQHLDSGKSGPVINSVNVQGQAGDRVTLIVNAVSSVDISFKWPV
jgi:CRISPR-associated protein Cmr6